MLQCSLGVIELAFVQVQAGELALSLGVLRSGLEIALVLVDHLLQRAKVQPLFIRRQTEQGVGRGKPHTLFAVIEQWPQQQRALGAGDQAHNALNRGNTYQRRRVEQVGVGQLECLRARIIGQFAMQAGAAGIAQIGAGQLLVKHAGGTGFAVMGHIQCDGIALVYGRCGGDRSRAHRIPEAAGNKC